MYMAYTTNPRLPRVRMDAVKLVRSGWSTRKVAAHLGYSQAAIVQWMKRAPLNRRMRTIPTQSSKPHSHPKTLSEKLVNAIVAKREEHNRCAEVVHEELKKQGIVVSLSSVQRTLKRKGLIKTRSPWKRWHSTFPRPIAEKPGDLVENDNAHIERFNRSIQEESLDHVPKEFSSYRKAIKKYLAYYNGERSHMGIDFLTPLQKIAELITSY